jgi:hypothetical protein
MAKAEKRNSTSAAVTVTVTGVAATGQIGKVTPGRIWEAAADLRGGSEVRAAVLRNPRLVDDTSDIKRPMKRWRQDAIRAVAQELWPGGPPSTTSTPRLLQKLDAALLRHKIYGGSKDTLKRALGRR